MTRHMEGVTSRLNINVNACFAPKTAAVHTSSHLRIRKQHDSVHSVTRHLLETKVGWGGPPFRLRPVRSVSIRFVLRTCALGLQTIHFLARRPCCVVALRRTAWSEHGMGAAWAWHGKCESDTAALCKSHGKDILNP